MRIAHVVPYSVRFPLTTPNGRYSWVLQLAQLQASRGHHVTLYGHPGSIVDGLVTKGIGHAQANDSKYENNIATLRLAFQDGHDVYHSHFDHYHYDVATEANSPIVYTQHWWPDDTVVSKANQQRGNVWAVPPTKYMYQFDITNGIATKGYIYHGIDLSAFNSSKLRKNGRLLFVGRIAPEKNLDLAMRVATQSGIGLDIIGKIPEKYQTLWKSLKPLVDGRHIRYLGTKTQSELPAYYTAARAVIFPSDVTESFGLVAIESQACGTPIIMKRGGSRSELLIDRRTGFLCDTTDDFVAAVHASDSIESSHCRNFADKFSVDTMCESYLKLYDKLL